MQTLLRILDQPPAAAALRCGSRLLTYDALIRRAAAFADELRRRELDDGGRVALVLAPGMEAPAVLLGCWLAGALPLQLSPTLPPDRLDATLRRAGVELLVAEGEAGVALARRLGWQDRAVLHGAPASWSGQRLSGILRRRPSSLEGRRWGADEPCLLHFADHGPLRGRLVPARALDSFVTFWREELAAGSNDRVAWTPQLPGGFHGLDLLVGLSSGATVLPVPGDHLGAPARLGRWLQEREVTVWCSEPGPLLALLHAGLCEPDPPGDLRCVLVAGLPLDGPDARDMVRMLPWCRAWTVFAGPSVDAACGYELPDWFDPADPPLARAVPSLTSDALPDRRPGLRDTA